MKRCISVLFTVLLCILVCSFSVDSANAQDNVGNKLICLKGMVITNEYSLSKCCATEIKEASIVVCPDSCAVLQSDCGMVNITESTWVDIKDGVYVKEGIVAVDALYGEINIETGTQKAVVSPGGRLTVRVDDYGNAFNYCTGGSVELYSKLNDSSMTLNSGEYIAVTVKRGFRKLKDTSDEDVAQLGVIFTEFEDLNRNFEDCCEIIGIKSDFSQDGDIESIKSNRMYLLESSDGSAIPSRTVYLDCNNDEAVLCVYDTNLNLIASSLNEKRANKPNVTILSDDKSSQYILCVYSQNDVAYSLKQIKYESILDKCFDMVKSFAIPVLAALVLFAIYGIAESKVKKKPKF